MSVGRWQPTLNLLNFEPLNPSPSRQWFSLTDLSSPFINLTRNPGVCPTEIKDGDETQMIMSIMIEADAGKATEERRSGDLPERGASRHLPTAIRQLFYPVSVRPLKASRRRPTFNLQLSTFNYFLPENNQRKQ